MQTQGSKPDFIGQNIYVGIDIHKKSWNITVMMETLFSNTFSQSPPSAEKLYEHLTSNYPGAIYYSAYEAGFSGFWPHFQFTKLGIHSIVVNPADIPTTGKEKIQKTDPRDSKKIARALRNEELTPIYVPSENSLDDRGLTRFRKTVSNDLARTKNRIKSFLNLYGHKIPEDIKDGKWPKIFIKWLTELELPSSSRLILNGHLATLKYLSEKKKEVQHQIKSLSQSQEYKENAELLQSIPGIGLTTAMTLLTELEDIKRFETLDQLCSFFGLVPSTRASGENEGVGNITPRARAILRSTIVESAWVAAEKDPALALSYAKLYKRMSGPKAIIRIARKLLSRIRFVLQNRTEYDFGVIESRTKHNSIKQPVI